jgi:uncharacterized protein YjiK
MTDLRPFLLFTVLLCTCVRAQAQRGNDLPFDLSRGEALSRLPEELAEISGLAIRREEIYAIGDEEGSIFVLDREKGHLLRRIDFGEDGDYEGIALVGDDIWVLESNGMLYRVTEAGGTETYDTWLSGGNDAEGLAYDPTRNRLLVACKDDIRGDGRPKENRYVFAFDLESRTLAEREIITMERRGDFSPAGIAVHADGSLYLCSSVENWLARIDTEGRILAQRKLSKQKLPRAEGIAFDSDDRLYLSTEAHKGEPARIYHFAPVK